MLYEDHSLWLHITSKFLSAEYLEHPRLHHCYDRVRVVPVPTILSSSLMNFSLFSSLLAVLQIEGINVKSLRAFRVLRPLRLLSSIPSKYQSREVTTENKSYDEADYFSIILISIQRSCQKFRSEVFVCS